MEDNNTKIFTITESNVLDVYKQLVGITDKETLSDKEINTIMERFNELVNYKSK